MVGAGTWHKFGALALAKLTTTHTGMCCRLANQVSHRNGVATDSELLKILQVEPISCVLRRRLLAYLSSLLLGGPKLLLALL